MFTDVPFEVAPTGESPITVQTCRHAILTMLITLERALQMWNNVIMLLSSVRLECFQIRKTQEASITHQLSHLQSASTRDHGLRRCTILRANNLFCLRDSKIFHRLLAFIMVSSAMSTKCITYPSKSIQHRVRHHRVSRIREPSK